MSILSELKKLSGKNNATVVSKALPLVLPVPTERDTGKCPVVKADGTYELSDAPFELPEVSSSDAGKGLFVDSNGTWGKEYPPAELPVVSSEDAGKGLFVDSNGTWGKDNPPRQVPQPGNDDDGKYLMVAGGQYVFATPSGNDSDLFNIVVRKTEDDTWSIEQEWADVMAAFNAGKYIIITLHPYYPSNTSNFIRGFAKYEYSGFDRFVANLISGVQGPPGASKPFIYTYVVSVAWNDRLQSVNISVDTVQLYGSSSAT